MTLLEGITALPPRMRRRMMHLVSSYPELVPHMEYLFKHKAEVVASKDKEQYKEMLEMELRMLEMFKVDVK